MGMDMTLQISFHGVAQSDDLVAQIRKGAAKLRTLHPRIERCRVFVESVGHRPESGPVGVRIDVRKPGREAVSSLKEHEDVLVALRDAFEAARRQLDAERARVPCHAS
jgi:hypothetical protein